jgi:DNA-binding beta-propeller fold protein YncE
VAIPVPVARAEVIDMMNTRTPILFGFLLALGCTLGGKDKPMDPDAGFDGGPMTEVCVPTEVDPVPATGVGLLTGSGMAGLLDGDRSCALFDDPVNVQVMPSGDLLVADYNNHLIRRVSTAGDTIGTVDSFAGQVGFFRPFGIQYLPDGTMLAQTDWNTLGQQTPNNGAVWQLICLPSAENCLGAEATLLAEDTGRLRGMVPLMDGRVFATDYLNHYVGMFNPDTGAFSPLAGVRGTPGYAEGAGALARFFTPYDAVQLPDGDMVVTDFDNHCLRRVTLAGVVSTYAGLCGTSGFADGALGAARFNRPQGLTRDNAGIIYVTDIDNFRVRRIDLAGNVTTVAGSGVGGFADGPPLEAQFYGLEGLDVTPDGTMLYIADGDRGLGMMLPYHRVRRLPLVP